MGQDQVSGLRGLKDGDDVVGMTFESLEYDTEPEEVTGPLRLRYVESLDYVQYLVRGFLIDPKTLRRVEKVEAGGG